MVLRNLKVISYPLWCLCGELKCCILEEMAGIGGAELGDQFTVSQMVKTDAQLSLMENVNDIKVGD